MPYTTKEQIEQICDFKKNKSKRYIDNLFLYSASPVIRGAKPSVLFRISTEYMTDFRNRGEELCHATNLKVQEMHSSEKSVLVLIYDENKMKETLSDSLSLHILNQYGYAFSVWDEFDDLLGFLKTRLQKEEFPHEIGLFLGYPPDDVEAFIENEGKNCLLCRYWKVYHNVERAQEMFRQIDEAQSYALHLLHKPMSIYVAANMLKAM